MIIIKISGGLGNQLFQYALAKSLEDIKKLKVKIDVSNFKIVSGVTKRNFCLDKFNITLQTAEAIDFKNIGVPYPLSKNKINKLMFKVQEFFRTKSKKKVLIEHDLNYKKSIFNTIDNRYICGSWTSPKYFYNVKNDLIKEIKPNFKMSNSLKETLIQIKRNNSVSIHIRRGDYIKYQHKFEILSLDYYKKAIEIIKNKIKDPLFFIFSDDITYVKENFKNFFNKNIIYVSDNKFNDYEELWLMKSCKNNIIANSTFSWWAAWLNQNPNKIIIAPSKYRSDNKSIDDLIPESWIKI